jgi:hypothetical protein
MLVLVVAALLAQQASAAVTGAGARVMGRVVSTYAAGVDGVTVVLVHTDGRGDRRTTTTDARGRFAFDRVSDGAYEISANKTGYTTRRLVENAARFVTGTSLAVRDGKPVDVEVSLRRAATIGGRVIRSNGAAAPGIHVVLAQRSGRNLVVIDETQTTTEWDGRYSITGLPPGSYFVLASGVDRSRAKGLLEAGSPEQAAFEINLTRPEEFTRTLYPGVPATEPGASVTLMEGVVTEGIDIWLTPARRFSISGRVTWPPDAKVGDITIEYGNPADRRASIWTFSDPGGVFSIDSVAPGTVVLLATANSDRGTLMGVVSTDVRAANVDDLPLALAVPGTVRGTVIFPADLPASARPKTIALVPALLHVSPLYAAPEAMLSADGSFTLTNALGEYEVALSGLPSGYRIVSVSRDAAALPRNRIGVASGETITGITIRVGR